MTQISFGALLLSAMAECGDDTRKLDQVLTARVREWSDGELEAMSEVVIPAAVGFEVEQ